MKFKFLLFFLFTFKVVLIAQNSILTQFQKVNELSNYNITSIIQDDIGYLILGTKEHGILYFNGKETDVFTEKDGLISNQINTIFFKNDSLIIATNKGLSIQKNNGFTLINSDEIYKIYTFKNHFYFLLENGIAILRNDKIESLRLPPEIHQQKINDILFDGTHFWIATTKNLFRIDDIQNTKQVITIAKGNFTSLLFYNHKILVSDFDHGLFEVKKLKLHNKINNNLKILSLKKFDKQLWLFLKDNGLELISADDFSFIRKINKYNSIIDNNVSAIFKDRQQTIWLASETNFYTLPSKEANLKKDIKPTVFLTSIEVLFKPLDSINCKTYQKNLPLKTTQNHISFSFTSVDLNEPNSILYRYKLNDEFSPWSKKNTLDFANLDAGDYTFFYQAKKEELESDLKKFSFTIQQPFYKKNIFQVIFFIGFLLIILGMTVVYLRKIKRRNKANVAQLELENHLISLEQKAMQLQMNPHFIFNVLNSIKAYGIKGDANKLSETIAKFSKLLRNVLNNSKQEEISLQTEIDTLKNYIELEQEISPFTFDFSIKKSLKNVSEEEILIPPMLVQPFVENAIQHAFSDESNKNEITISFENKNGFIYCVIQDNGIGINKHQQLNKNKKHKSLAIEITKERIKNCTKYNQFSIEELNDLGTKVSFKIPLKTDY